MLEKEKEWYDVEIDDDFFNDDIKELKSFDSPNKKVKSSCVKIKTFKESENNYWSLDNLNLGQVDEKESFENKDIDDAELESKNNKFNFDTITATTIEQKVNDEEIQNIIKATDEDIEKLEDEDDDKASKLSFEEYILENNINLENIKANISAALYIAGDDGLDINTLKKVTEQPSWFVKKMLTIMIGEYWTNESLGIAIELYQKVFKFVTKPKCFEGLSKVIDTKFKNPLSQSVMETLAIIAYNQPCRRSVIEKIRAKDPKAAIDRLLSLDLITSKKSDFPGRPFVYTVTSKFYDLFDLKSLSQLPKIETRLLNDLPTNETPENDE